MAGLRVVSGGRREKRGGKQEKRGGGGGWGEGLEIGIMTGAFASYCTINIQPGLSTCVEPISFSVRTNNSPGSSISPLWNCD